MILRWLLSAVDLIGLKGEASTMMRRVRRGALLVALVILLWLTAFGFAVAALALWLASELGGIAACAILAGALSVIGLGIQLVLGARRKPNSRSNLCSPGQVFNTGAKTSAFGSIVIIAVVGYLLGRQTLRK